MYGYIYCMYFRLIYVGLHLPSSFSVSGMRTKDNCSSLHASDARVTCVFVFCALADTTTVKHYLLVLVTFVISVCSSGVCLYN
jgi:hypothetical protein